MLARKNRHLLLLPLLLLLWAAPSGCREQNSFPGADTGAGPDLAPSPDRLTAVLNDAYLGQLTRLLDGARTSIRAVQLYLKSGTTCDTVLDHLARAARRGVTVQVLLEDSVDTNPARLADLQKLGIQARLDSRAHMTHAKLIVVDGTRAMLGSTNWSGTSMSFNNEANLLLEEPALAGYYDKYASSLWQDSSSMLALAPVASRQSRAISDGGYVEQARPLISGANNSIRLVVYGLYISSSYPDSDVNKLVDLMSQAARRGVEVRVILEQANYSTSINKVNQDSARQMQARGIQVRADPLDQITHAKVLLVDDQVILGSNNWGYGGFFDYHEVALRTSQAAVVKKLGDYFEGIWKRSTDFK
jgi:phosphatidylserine/phosphatidylglycerophosphate/cardiolipin synthase-like enzyme